VALPPPSLGSALLLGGEALISPTEALQEKYGLVVRVDRFVDGTISAEKAIPTEDAP